MHMKRHCRPPGTDAAVKKLLWLFWKTRLQQGTLQHPDFRHLCTTQHQEIHRFNGRSVIGENAKKFLRARNGACFETYFKPELLERETIKRLGDVYLWLFTREDLFSSSSQATTHCVPVSHHQPQVPSRPQFMAERWFGSLISKSQVHVFFTPLPGIGAAD